MRTAWCVAGAVVMGLLGAAGSAVPAQPPATDPMQDKVASPDLPGPYDTSAEAGQQVAAALRNAKRDNTRVLVQFGGNWCPKCIELHKLVTTDKALKKELGDEYQYVLVDYGQPPGKNKEMVNQYQAGAREGVPYLTVLDSSGRMFANQAMTDFEDGRDAAGVVKYDTAVFLKFLKANQAPPVGAQSVLDKGLAEAAKSGKRVFLHFGAPWCPWCHRLDDWLSRPEVAAVLSKDFVDVKIDTDRFTGGAAMLKKYNGGKETGIPWFVMLDAEGKALADSFGKDKQNIGFPAEPEEVEQFGSALKAASRAMSAAEIDGLLATLKEKPKDAGGGH